MAQTGSSHIPVHVGPHCVFASSQVSPQRNAEHVPPVVTGAGVTFSGVVVGDIAGFCVGAPPSGVEDTGDRVGSDVIGGLLKVVEHDDDVVATIFNPVDNIAA